jgi:hypothetical protein
MAKRHSPVEELPDDLPTPPPLYYALTPNQVVAYNLHQVRLWHRLTQDQAAEVLAPYVGKRWSKANFSAAERSVAGDRIRQFDADEIVAFAKAFDVPITWFFLPPVPWAHDSAPVHLDAGADNPEPLATLADLVFGNEDGQGLLGLRLQSFLQDLGPAPLSDIQHRIAMLVNAKKVALVEHAIADLTTWQTSLRALANQLEDLQVRARDAAFADLAVTDEAAPASSDDHSSPRTGTGPARTRKRATKK